MAQAPYERIHAETNVGFVAINTPDPAKLSDFYEQVIGLQARQDEAGEIHLGAAGGRDILVLSPVEASDQTALGSKPTTGLYHLAILVPSRRSLAQSLRHIVEADWPLQGFADHWVSEAIYLADPEGNGIEIYRDRPRSEWPYQGGQLRMATEPLDVDGVLSELQKPSDPQEAPNGAGSNGRSGIAPETVLGHIHLQVSDIAAAEHFYCDVLGFDLVTRYGPSASFVSAGGYHHHIGFNTWNTRGASPPAKGAPGLRYFALRLPNTAELGRIVDRLRSARLPVQEVELGVLTEDASGNSVLLTALPAQ